jgi:hypothetical protein
MNRAIVQLVKFVSTRGDSTGPLLRPFMANSEPAHVFLAARKIVYWLDDFVGACSGEHLVLRKDAHVFPLVRAMVLNIPELGELLEINGDLLDFKAGLTDDMKQEVILYTRKHLTGQITSVYVMSSEEKKRLGK